MNLNIKPTKGIIKTILNDVESSSKSIVNDSAKEAESVKPSGTDSIKSYVVADIRIKNKVKYTEEDISEILKNKFLSEYEQIDELMVMKQGNIVRMRAGKEIPGFKGLCSDDKRICCYLDENGGLNKIYVKNNKTNEIESFNALTGRVIYYSSEDVKALQYYKSHPDAIHSKLRYGRDIYSGSFKEEMNETINQLRNIFNEESKLETTEKNMTLYRAVPSGFIPEDTQKAGKIGEVFTEKSFCSTTTSLEDAKRFAHGKNPIMEIEVPAGTKYADMDALFNIDREHWREHEYLLDESSSFIIKGFDKENNIIKVALLK